MGIEWWVEKAFIMTPRRRQSRPSRFPTRPVAPRIEQYKGNTQVPQTRSPGEEQKAPTIICWVDPNTPKRMIITKKEWNARETKIRGIPRKHVITIVAHHLQQGRTHLEASRLCQRMLQKMGASLSMRELVNYLYPWRPPSGEKDLHLAFREIAQERSLEEAKKELRKVRNLRAQAAQRKAEKKAAMERRIAERSAKKERAEKGKKKRVPQDPLIALENRKKAMKKRWTNQEYRDKMSKVGRDAAAKLSDNPHVNRKRSITMKRIREEERKKKQNGGTTIPKEDSIVRPGRLDRAKQLVMRSAILSLSPVERDIAIMFLQKIPIKEIAKKVGLPLARTEELKDHAMRRIHQIVSGEYHP